MNTRYTHVFWVALVVVSLASASPNPGAGATPGAGLFGTFGARDTLNVEDETSDDARQMLDELAWESEDFEVVCQAADDHGYALVTFPSPKPSGDAVNDRVVMEWYVARDKAGQPVKAPAMLVLHILDGRMKVARLIARTFAFSGTHAFVMHLPQYGQRRGSRSRDDVSQILARVHQGIADARRARDAIAALPQVENDQIGIEGTSLGGFVTSVTAAIDDAFDPVFIVLAGADVHGILVNGQKDSKKVRQRLAEAGYDDQ